MKHQPWQLFGAFLPKDEVGSALINLGCAAEAGAPTKNEGWEAAACSCMVPCCWQPLVQVIPHFIPLGDVPAAGLLLGEELVSIRNVLRGCTGEMEEEFPLLLLASPWWGWRCSLEVGRVKSWGAQTVKYSWEGAQKSQTGVALSCVWESLQGENSLF